MKIFVSKEFEDLKFAVKILDPTVEISSCDEGIRCDDVEGFEEVAKKLLMKYQPSKSLKDLKKIRASTDLQTSEKTLLSLIAFYNNFKFLLTTSNLKYSKFTLGMDYLFFYVIQIQVGQVTNVKEVEGSEKLYLETVDFGDKKMEIVSGIRQIISKEEFVGGKFLFITNIKPSRVMGIPSNGMILCGRENEKVCVIRIPDEVSVGSRLVLEKENIVEEYEPSTIDIKKAFYRNVFDKLQIKNGYIEFDGLRAMVVSKPVQTEINNGVIS